MSETKVTEVNLDKHIVSILARLPDVLADPSYWRDIMTMIRDAVSASHALIAERTHDHELVLGETPWTHELVNGYGGPSEIEKYMSYYRQLDFWARIEAFGDIDETIIASQHATLETWRNSEFWDWLKPLDINQTAAIRLYRTERGWVGLSLHGLQKHMRSEEIRRLLKILQQPLKKHLLLQEYGFCPDPALLRKSLQGFISRNQYGSWAS